MSTLSIHVSASPTNLSTELKKCHDAGSPIGILYSVNQNLSGDIKANSPTTLWTYRRQTAMFNRLPDNFFNDNPVESATNWLVGSHDPADKQRTQIDNLLLNAPDYVDVINEPAIELADPNNPAQVAEAVRRAKYLNTWTITCLEITHAVGLKMAIFSFPSESPPVDARVWNELIPSMRLGKTYGALLSLHAYGMTGKLSNLPASYLRHRDIYKLIPEDARLPVVYSECGAGNGYNTGISGQVYVDDLATCDLEWMKDPYVWGACSFQLGVGVESNMAEIMGIYGDYISKMPTPEVDMAGEPRVDYVRVVNVYPASATEARVAEISLIAFKNGRSSVTGSYDDAGVGILTNKTANLWDIPLADRQKFIDFYAQYYLGTKVEFYPKV